MIAFAAKTTREITASVPTTVISATYSDSLLAVTQSEMTGRRTLVTMMIRVTYTQVEGRARRSFGS